VDESGLKCEVVLLLCKTEDHICAVCEGMNKTHIFRLQGKKISLSQIIYFFFPEYFVE